MLTPGTNKRLINSISDLPSSGIDQVGGQNSSIDLLQCIPRTRKGLHLPGSKRCVCVWCVCVCVCVCRVVGVDHYNYTMFEDQRQGSWWNNQWCSHHGSRWKEKMLWNIHRIKWLAQMARAVSRSLLIIQEDLTFKNKFDSLIDSKT